MAEVILDRVRKIYPEGIEAVGNISLHIYDKELMVLVGPSGCGKSTLLRIISGLEEPTGGTIRIGSQIVNNKPPKDRNIAMVFQSYALYPHMSVYENMAFSLRLRKMSKEQIDAQVRKAAEALNINDLLQRKPKALSGGQRQRVAVGRAIVRNPHVFLFDEPLSNLDTQLRVEMRKELNRLHKRLMTTMIYVTHDQVEAMTLGDRICVMSKGRIHQVGEPLKIYDYPADRFVAGFIGTPPMNFLPGRLIAAKGRLIFESGTFNLVLPPRLQTSLEQVREQDIILGIRPEHIEPIQDRASPAFSNGIIKGTVEVREMLGAEQIVYITTAQQSLVCKINNNYDISIGEKIALRPDLEKAHIFNSNSGTNLTAV